MSDQPNYVRVRSARHETTVFVWATPADTVATVRARAAAMLGVTDASKLTLSIGDNAPLAQDSAALLTDHPLPAELQHYTYRVAE
mmetsp:Transcript_17576/g.43186  ORF Transcript_17576/g.43186 Transcript_17576/m.43186 type:complete len:85 (-) Transcript_17576:46-300(-)|eukprot:CAMPEP_0198340522 /NCGR_PEP_ID=MMETSP1450-20131203/44853_1 /TAXON_ID=753684 ORGANISM="Madagascaria erythrocladiodes, Strain CCMP3234" /NCGR_SAMPLE_ID=MMETSP1450 /ASSEMBLY_ACC=CAM_ASM_001115 /LENGTH=84 /DNA_ID=CAMNT_0044045505 /DNA_START=6 /DNA_END=260 /DNA_ORIENTATION=-